MGYPLTDSGDCILDLIFSCPLSRMKQVNSTVEMSQQALSYIRYIIGPILVTRDAEYRDNHNAANVNILSYCQGELSVFFFLSSNNYLWICGFVMRENVF